MLNQKERGKVQGNLQNGIEQKRIWKQCCVCEQTVYWKQLVQCDLMARCTCYYEVGSDTYRRDTNPKCEVHGDKIRSDI